MSIQSHKMLPSHEGMAEELWQELRELSIQAQEQEPHLSSMLEDIIISRSNMVEAIAARLSRKLSRRDMSRDDLEPVIKEVLGASPIVMDCIAADLIAYRDRDAACHNIIEPLLFFKGFHALTAYRVSHVLWEQGRHLMALLFQSMSSEVFGVDIHPAAQIGCGIMIDHGTGVVIGETAIVENGVSILHSVTLGGTGKGTGLRHPIVRSGVLLGVGSAVLGRVEIGSCAKVAASSVVLEDVAARITVAGIPAVPVGVHKGEIPADCMNQDLS